MYLAAMAKFSTYSLHNVLLIKYQRPEATRVAGYRKWREFGRQVKLGAKGILILAPIFKCRGKEACEGEHCGPVAYRGVWVFDVEDTLGDPLPELGKTQGDPSGYTERLKEFICQRNGIQLQYLTAIYPALGRSSPGKIDLLPGQSPAEEFATLAHELAHLHLHQGPRRAETTKCIRETEAEAVAYVVCEAIGLKAQRGADYIQLYNGDECTITESLEHVHKASMEILSAIAPDA
jgi:hypothetical protein